MEDEFLAKWWPVVLLILTVPAAFVGYWIVGESLMNDYAQAARAAEANGQMISGLNYGVFPAVGLFIIGFCGLALSAAVLIAKKARRRWHIG